MWILIDVITQSFTSVQNVYKEKQLIPFYTAARVSGLQVKQVTYMV